MLCGVIQQTQNNHSNITKTNGRNMYNKGISEIKKQCAKYGVSTPELSMHLNVNSIRIYEIMHQKRRITIDTDLRLCKFFKLKNGHFLKLQIDYDTLLTEAKLHRKIATIKTVDDIITSTEA